MANLPALTPTTFAELMQFAEVLAKSTMVPREYQRQPANIVMAILGGRELGLGPFQSLLGITVINGKPSAYGDALLGLVRASPLCEDVIERIEGTGDNRTAICEARRKGAAPVVRSFSIADAKRAGLWGKSGPWQQYPDRMQQMRARSFALRDAFADLLRGIGQVEEMADIPREPKDITPPAAREGGDQQSGATAPLADALDAFAAEDTVNPETAIPRLPESPTEAEIERSQEKIDPGSSPGRLGPDEVGALDLDDLLGAARARTFNGYDDFRRWYTDEIDDDARYALRPHIRGLRDAARKADEPSKA